MRGSRMGVGRAASGRRAMVLMMALGGCASFPGSAPAVRCEGSSAPDTWTLQAGGVLQGVVSDLRGRPLPGATVRIRPAGADSTADRATRSVNQGAFAFDSVASGRYAAQATAPGYGTWTGTVQVAPDRGTVPRIRLCSGRA
jgi:hypothetical protein